MPIASTNQNWRIVTDVETLLEAEFGGDSVVYISDKYLGQKVQAIRLSEPTSDQLSRIAPMVTNRYAMTLMLEFPIGSNRRKSMELANDMFERIKRLLVNNCAYSPSAVYHWHDGAVEGTDNEPERDTDDDGQVIPPETVIMKELIWAVTVSEVLPA